MTKKIKEEDSNSKSVSPSSSAASSIEETLKDLHTSCLIIVKLFVPVSICILIVILTISAVEYYQSAFNFQDIKGVIHLQYI